MAATSTDSNDEDPYGSNDELDRDSCPWPNVQADLASLARTLGVKYIPPVVPVQRADDDA